MNLLLSPGLLLSVIATLASGLGYSTLRGCSQGERAAALESQLAATQEQLQRAQFSLVTIQAETLRQASEINKYNNLASQYRRELDTKYSLRAEAAARRVPCGMDFTSLNNMLQR